MVNNYYNSKGRGYIMVMITAILIKMIMVVLMTMEKAINNRTKINVLFLRARTVPSITSAAKYVPLIKLLSSHLRSSGARTLRGTLD